MVRTNIFGWRGGGGYPSSSVGSSPVAMGGYSMPTDGYNRRLIEVDEDLLQFDDDDDDDDDDDETSDFEFVYGEDDVSEDEGYSTIGPPLRRMIPADTAALLNFDDFDDDFSDDDDDEDEESESMEQWMQRFGGGPVITPAVPGTAYGYVSPSRPSRPRSSSVYYTPPSSPRGSFSQYYTPPTSPRDSYSQYHTPPQSARGYPL